MMFSRQRANSTILSISRLYRALSKLRRKRLIISELSANFHNTVQLIKCSIFILSRLIYFLSFFFEMCLIVTKLFQ